MIRKGDAVELTPAELSIYLELGLNDYPPSTVQELNAGVLRGMDHWERREASGLAGSKTFVELLRGLLVVDYKQAPPGEGDTS
jgi:hypothetical protein